MKKLIAGMLAGFVVNLGLGFAAPGIDHNGFFWNQLNGSAKTGYIDGYSDAMQVSLGKLDTLTIAAALFSLERCRQDHQAVGARPLDLGSQAPRSSQEAKRALFRSEEYRDLDLAQAMQLLPPGDLNPAAAAIANSAKPGKAGPR